MKCILYEEIPMCFISRLDFSIDSNWRKRKSEGTWINAEPTLHHGKCSQKTQIQLLFQPTWLISVCFESLGESWSESEALFGWCCDLRLQCQQKADIQKKCECWHTAYFLSLGVSWFKPGQGACHGLSYYRGKISFKLSEWQLKDLLLVLDQAVYAEAILPSTARRMLCSASDCLISVSTGRVAR